MKKLILLMVLCFYASSIVSSGPGMPKPLADFMTLPADFDDYTHDAVIGFIAQQFRTDPTFATTYVPLLNPFYVAVKGKGWLNELLGKACNDGNAEAQYIRALYDAKYYVPNESWWEHYEWGYHNEILREQGLSPDKTSDTFFEVIKIREHDPRAKLWIDLRKSNMLNDVLKHMTPKEINNELAITNPDFWTKFAAWLTKWKNTDIIELTAPNTWDYYIALCTNRAAQLTKWKQESELIRIGLQAGSLSDACLQALKDIKSNPFMLRVTTDFTSNHYPRLKTEFEAANTLPEIDRALKFLKELEDSGILTTSFDVQHALKTKKAELEAKVDNDPNKQDKDKKKNPNLTSQSPLHMVTVGLIFALGGYLIYKYYLQRADTSRYEADTEA